MGNGRIPPLHQKVFELFQTLKPCDTVEGSGMGLAFVKKIVEQVRGSVAFGPPSSSPRWRRQAA